MIINRKPKNKCYWRWRKRFALFPTKMLDTGEIIWLETYYWRYVFTMTYMGRRATRSRTPFPYIDEENHIELTLGIRKPRLRI